MSEILSQEEIDALITKYSDQPETIEVQYQDMICVYCHKKEKWKSLDMFDVFTNQKCLKNEYGHRFVNEGFLLFSKSRLGSRLDIKPHARIMHIIKSNGEQINGRKA